jgi:GDP/UDP-N,N'-diacetylbacillosamine 2-epimerase (hydrolysing)
MKKICVVTSTRAEYGLLRPLLMKIKHDGSFDLQLLVTGTHLAAEFGSTYQEIERDGFAITRKIEILLSSDTSVAIGKTMALAMSSFSEAFDQLKPDIVVILGDRYEMLAVAASASISRIPIAHLHGGETTEGAFDEAFRHSITKMSYLHFCSTEKYRKRIIQLGEDPKRVFNVGAIGIENIVNLQLPTRSELEYSIGFKIDERTILVTFHPVTLENRSSEVQFSNLIGAIDDYGLRVIFTKANADIDGRIINRLIDDYVKNNNDRAIAFASLGLLHYLSAVKYSVGVVGNSSSGIIEVPYFEKGTINIGDRQRGRIMADSVIQCEPTQDGIRAAFAELFSESFQAKLKNIIPPYGDGSVSDKIIVQIKHALNKGIDLKKKFYDVPDEF